jgi:cyclophilin family peptidyl-prolyl cis-trans isomerase
LKKKNFTPFRRPFLLAIAFAIYFSCLGQNRQNKQVLLTTSFGTLKIALYPETPRHRDNFYKLVSTCFYDSTLFHRVIPGFMVQGGDPGSKAAVAGQMLGNGDIGYKIPAEIKPAYFHKKGALAAARDNNPDKSSSGCQFYIVAGTVYTDSMLNLMEANKNALLKQQIFIAFINQKENVGLKNTFISLQKRGNRDSLQLLSKTIEPLVDTVFAKMPHFKFSEPQRKAYTTIGGAPHLDGDYTVFGEVTEGLDVIDKLTMVKKDEHDRPLQDIRMQITPLKNP